MKNSLTYRPTLRFLTLLFGRLSLGWGLLAFCGCISFNEPDRLFRVEFPSQGLFGGKKDTPTDKNSTATNDSQSAENKSTPDALASDMWILSTSPSGYRWKHPELEELLSAPVDDRPNLHDSLQSENRVVAANGAIFLARAGDAAGVKQLTETIRDAAQPERLRLASAEALSSLKDEAALKQLEELCDQYARLAESVGTAYPVKVHAELLRGAGRHGLKQFEPLLIAAISHSSVDIRLAALSAWEQDPNRMQPAIPLPEVLLELRTDPDPRIRSALLLAMAVRQDPQALEMAKAMVRDYDLQTRLAAIEALGRLRGEESRQILSKLVETEAEIIRAAATQALGLQKDVQALTHALEDEAWRVRREAAASLESMANHEGVILALKLMQDPSSEVHERLLISLESWPVELSGPILLEGMKGGGYMTRKRSAEILSRKWTVARKFRTDAPEAEREQVLAELSQEWVRQYGALAVEEGLRAVAPRVADGISQISPEQIRQAEWLIRSLSTIPSQVPGYKKLLRELGSMGPELPAVLEQLALEQGIALPEVVYREILPAASREFDLVQRLADPDVNQRRAAAQELVQLSGDGPISRLARERLAQLGVSQQDQIVWQELFRVMRAQADEPALRLAYAAISHPQPDVRRMACQYLAEHGGADHADVLLAAISDPHAFVVEAAVEALGTSGRISNVEPLERLLRTADAPLQLKLGVTLSRNQASSGPETLLRLIHDRDPEIRRRAVIAMGELRNELFLPVLIMALDDTTGVRGAVFVSLTQIAGRDVSLEQDGTTPNSTERIRRWRKWWEDREKNTSRQ